MLKKDDDKLTRAQKDQNREQIAKVKDGVEKELNQMTWEEAKKKLNGKDGNGNPLENFNLDRTKRLSKTMYWM